MESLSKEGGGQVLGIAELEAYFDSCSSCNLKWSREIQERIELVFGKKLSKLNKDGKLDEALNNDRRLSRTYRTKVDPSVKCALLLKILAVSIPDYGYDSRMSIVLEELRIMMGLNREMYIREVERHLEEQIKSGYLSEAQSLQAQSTRAGKVKKKLLIGLGVLAGGVAVGITAGLAAPVVIPFFASLFGISSSAAFLTGTTATALFAVTFGAGGAGLTGYKIERRYREIHDFYFLPIISRDQMKVSLGISGWIDNDKDIIDPWTSLACLGTDLYVLECEKDAFKRLGSAMGEFITDAAFSYATLEILKTTAMATAVAALTWPIAVIQAGSLIDNPWSVCLNISKKAGLILADVIKNRVHGHRPVHSFMVSPSFQITLAGFSLGALTIFECLLELSNEPETNLGVIENVLLFGLPEEIMPIERWGRIRALIAGRFIHCYSKNDWVLRFLFRSTSLAIGNIAGINPIENVDGIENVNMSNFVKGHLEYTEKMPEMLQLFNL